MTTMIAIDKAAREMAARALAPTTLQIAKDVEHRDNLPIEWAMPSSDGDILTLRGVAGNDTRKYEIVLTGTLALRGLLFFDTVLGTVRVTSILISKTDELDAEIGATEQHELIVPSGTVSASHVQIKGW